MNVPNYLETQLTCLISRHNQKTTLGGGSRGRVLPGVKRRQLGEASPSPRRKTPEKGKLKTTLEDIKTEETGSVRLRKKDYDRPDVVLAKKEELDKFFKFSVIRTVPKAPKNSEIMRTTWVIMEKPDNMTKTGSRIKARFNVPWEIPLRSFPKTQFNLSLQHVVGIQLRPFYR